MHFGYISSPILTSLVSDRILGVFLVCAEDIAQGYQAISGETKEIKSASIRTALIGGRTGFNDRWYGRTAVPTGRTRCRRHRPTKWSNFREGTDASKMHLL